MHSVHYFPKDKPRRKTWTEYDEWASKTGVAGPFVKYIRWMGMFSDLLPLVTAAYRNFSEDSEEEEPGIAEQLPTGLSMAASSSQPPSTDFPCQPVTTFRQSTSVTNQWQSKNPNKRRITSPEEGTDMTIDNLNSSPSADPDEFLAKHPRRSPIIACGSETTADPQTPAASTVVNRSSPGTDAGDESDGWIIVGGMDAGWVGGLAQNLDVTGRATPLQFRQSDNALSEADTDPSPMSPDPPLEIKPIIPNFLTAKPNIYGYLVNIKEPGFMALLDNYIAFELADNSGVRGNLPTTHQPTAITRWSSRTHPDKTPPPDDSNKFANGVVKWWIFIQPNWRRGLACGETSRRNGCWEGLYQPGINGLLNIVILVYWWAKSLEARGESGDTAYHWLVADVTWVLSQLVCVASEGFSPA